MSDFKIGDIVRYGAGHTALAKLESLHAEVFRALHCKGGAINIPVHHCHRPSFEDLKEWDKHAQRRKEKATPDFNAWFCSLPEGRQAVLREDKWILAEAAFNAGKEIGK